jgi:hypothetical protein
VHSTRESHSLTGKWRNKSKDLRLEIQAPHSVLAAHLETLKPHKH